MEGESGALEFLTCFVQRKIHLAPRDKAALHESCHPIREQMKIYPGKQEESESYRVKIVEKLSGFS